ncbi:MAG TPA: hypothetical protein VN369_01015, partial [Terriglobales bacterium]|nr:hypothetical protein [Terriglobales bacterium]
HASFVILIITNHESDIGVCGVFEPASANMCKTTSAPMRTEDSFAPKCAAQPKGRYCFIFADTAYAVSVFVLPGLLGAAVVTDIHHVHIAAVLLAVLVISLPAALRLAHRTEYKMSIV